MPRTVTVPPVTVVLIRARKVPDTLPTRCSVVAFAGTAIVVNAVQTIAPADPDPGAIGVFWGQHSKVTAPAVTLPLPWTLKVGASARTRHFHARVTRALAGELVALR
jgi:hypothetical protein